MGNRIIHKSSQNQCSTHSPGSGLVDFSCFTIVRSIGRGSYGKVCIVKKKDTKELYAMKYMNKAECIKEDAVRNILQELRLLRIINCAHIVNLRFAFHDIEDMVLVVDLLQGGDLRYHLEKTGRFCEQDVSIYLIELSFALEYLKTLQILHRDIKPDNLLLGLDGHIHLTDFNVATRLGTNGLSQSESGTRSYMAPEIFSTKLGHIEGYSYSVDWWSLAVTCYELSHGQRPFEVPQSRSAALSMFEKSPHIQRCSSSLSSKFAAVLSKMLTVDTQERLMSLSELSTLLDLEFEDITSGKVKPAFLPSVKKLNVNPTYELEEMIIESKPIHKKQSRLCKSSSAEGAATNAPTTHYSTMLAHIELEFEPFNYLANGAASVPDRE